MVFIKKVWRIRLSVKSLLLFGDCNDVIASETTFVNAPPGDFMTHVGSECLDCEAAMNKVVQAKQKLVLESPELCFSQVQISTTDLSPLLVVQLWIHIQDVCDPQTEPRAVEGEEQSCDAAPSFLQAAANLLLSCFHSNGTTVLLSSNVKRCHSGRGRGHQEAGGGWE